MKTKKSLIWFLASILILNSLTIYIKAKPLVWTIETVDEVENVGEYTSLVLDSDDNPHISYYHVSNGDLMYAYWTGSAWSRNVVDSFKNVGDYTSIALDSKGNPHISYRNFTSGDLKYANGTGSAWDTTTIGSTIGNAGLDTTIVIDSNDNPYILFRNATYGTLRLANWTGTYWSLSIIDGSDRVGRESDMVLDSYDHPHICYRDSISANLMYTNWNGSHWKRWTIDGSSNLGRFSSIALDSNNYPHISYYDLTNDDLKYAKFDNSSWSFEILDSIGNVGEHTSIAIDSTDYPHISYQDVSNHALKYIWWNGTNWNNCTIDEEGNTGQFTSLVLDSEDNPHISYWSQSSGDLFYTTVVIETIILVADAGSDQIIDEDTPVILDGSASTYNTHTPTYTWTFEDTTTKTMTGSTQSYIFTNPGTYQITLNLTDNLGNYDTDTLTVTVNDITGPIADSGSDQIIDEDTLVIFDGSGSSDNVGISSWNWIFMDETLRTLTSSNPTYTFETPGEFEVTLNVDDEAGNEATDNTIIIVKDITPPDAKASLDLTVDVDESTSYNAISSTDNVGIISYEWNFGDGSTSTDVSTIYTYTESGSYTITLTVKDEVGLSDTVTFSINVKEVQSNTGGGIPGPSFATLLIGIGLSIMALFYKQRERL